MANTTPQLVRSKTAAQTAGTSGSFTLASGAASGNVIVVTLVGGASATCSFSAATVTDSAGNTYTLRAQTRFGTGTTSAAAAIFTANVATAIATNGTVSWSGAVGTTVTDGTCEEWTNVDTTTGPIDGTPVTLANAGGSSTNNLPAITTTRPYSTLITAGGTGDNGGSAGTGAGNTSIYVDNNIGAIGTSAEYRQFAAAGSSVIGNAINGNGSSLAAVAIALMANTGASTGAASAVNRLMLLGCGV